MILSPPFLPARQDADSDEQYVRRAMTGGDPGSGSYPVSYQMNWHGGLHLAAPNDPNNVPLPVRAIADGTVIFVRQPSAQSNDANHPLNYGAGWTDDGCVIIRHDTVIGTDQRQLTMVTFFSIYMHLATISQDLRKDGAVYRKAILGTAGRIYGAAGRIHFEIICDDTNVQRLTGRSSAYMQVAQNGRTDAVFGSMYFFLLTGTQFLAQDPVGNAAQPAVVHTNTEAYPVEMRFENGDCIMQTYHLDGRPLAQRRDAGFEYRLHTTATQTFPGSPSAGFELLRFGRVIGPDALNPPNHEDWRQVAYGGGVGWVNLNAPGVRKFSDADFPSWGNGWWRLIDGSSSSTSRCKELGILELLDSNGDLKVTPQEGQAALNRPEIQDQLSHRICKFSTEWDSDTIDQRWSWLKTDPQTKMNATSYARFKAHVTQLSFWNAASLGIDAVHWRFHPTRFITHFRQCGWLSLDELTQLLPRQFGAVQHHTARITWATARARLTTHQLNLNLMFRKYNILSARRQIQFLAQAHPEIDKWQTMREYSRGRDSSGDDVLYDAFYGRGVMQLTWAGTYADYGFWRQFPQVAQNFQYSDNRITNISLHSKAGGPKNFRWFPRYDPDDVAADDFNCSDAAGFFWVLKAVNRDCDLPFSTASVGNVCLKVNGGFNAFAERQSCAAFIKRYRDDDTETTLNDTFHVVRIRMEGHPPHPVNHAFDIFVDFIAQRP